jgi:predicted DNA-binding transcriptional regulator YafY
VYHPTTRVLTVLELLQRHHRLTGPELAARLEVNIRTARRYITMLQDLGIPVEAERGRHGAYSLRAGFKLPPLMFTEDEALALTLGLLAARRLGLAASAPAVEGALAKVERAMPTALRERVGAVQESLSLDLGPRVPGGPLGAVIVVLSAATQGRTQAWLRYRAWNGSESERAIDPYGLVYREGFWYTVGRCHLRGDLRVFRLDRVLEARPLDVPFERPESFDTAAYVARSIALMPNTWTVEALLCTSLERARALVSPTLATLEEAENGVLLRAHVESLDWTARFLAQLGVPLRVLAPAELREALRRLAASIEEMAAGG